MKNILILSANPNANSFNHSLATAYADSAKAAGHEAKLIRTTDLNYQYDLVPGLELEPDLLKLQDQIHDADHVVVVMPVWWYGPPANLKALFDRLLTPGFAYKYPHPWKPLRPFLPRRLLKGRSVRIITTQDSYRPVAWAMAMPIGWSMRIATFWYVGFWPVRHTRFTRVRFADEDKRSKWMSKVARLGSKAK
ncbi:MAG: NAD(P)H-dependent oxidoreductase [Patescibacteria group bacterium]